MVLFLIMSSKASPTEFYKSRTLHSSNPRSESLIVPSWHPRSRPCEFPFQDSSPLNARFGAVKRTTWAVPLIAASTCPPGRRHSRGQTVGTQKIWRFPARHGGTPIAGWFIGEHPIIRLDDLGVPPFMELLESMLAALQGI